MLNVLKYLQGACLFQNFRGGGDGHAPRPLVSYAAGMQMVHQIHITKPSSNPFFKQSKGPRNTEVVLSVAEFRFRRLLQDLFFHVLN